MDSLQSRLLTAPYKDISKLARGFGIPGNLKKSVLIDAIIAVTENRIEDGRRIILNEKKIRRDRRMATSMARRQNEKLRKAAAGNNLSLVMFGDGDVINSAVNSSGNNSPNEGVFLPYNNSSMAGISTFTGYSSSNEFNVVNANLSTSPSVNTFPFSQETGIINCVSNGQGSGNMSAAPRTTSLYPNIYQPNASFVDSAASSRFEMCNISSSFGIYSTGFAQVNSCTVSESTVYTGQVNQMEQLLAGDRINYTADDDIITNCSPDLLPDIPQLSATLVRDQLDTIDGKEFGINTDVQEEFAGRTDSLYDIETASLDVGSSTYMTTYAESLYVHAHQPINEARSSCTAEQRSNEEEIYSGPEYEIRTEPIYEIGADFTRVSYAETAADAAYEQSMRLIRAAESSSREEEPIEMTATFDDDYYDCEYERYISRASGMISTTNSSSDDVVDDDDDDDDDGTVYDFSIKLEDMDTI